MGSEEPGIASAIVAPVMRALVELGYDAAARKGALIDPVKPNVGGTAADGLLDDAAEQLGDPALGLSLATRIPMGGLGDLDYALCTSVTLKEGLARLARFYGVVTQRIGLTLEEGPPHAALVFERRVGTPSRHWLEFSFALIAERIRLTVGRDVAFAEISFAHPPPADSSRHDAFFGTKVRFGERDRLAFASELLDSPLLTAAAALAEVLEAKMRAIQPTSDPVDPLLLRVRNAVVDLLDVGETSVPATAARLGTSARTLQRELGERGTSHREIVDDVRRERARRMLDEGGSIEEIARRLGFSEPSAFFRAFRRWTGTSPKASVARAK